MSDVLRITFDLFLEKMPLTTSRAGLSFLLRCALRTEETEHGRVRTDGLNGLTALSFTRYRYLIQALANTCLCHPSMLPPGLFRTVLMVGVG